MKVYIGKYINWIGPYQIAEYIPFTTEAQQHKIGEWLAKTWVNKFCNWFYSKKQRNIKVRIDPYDTWSMDNTLAHIILPMLKQLKETKHGSPYTDLEDVPEHMRYEDTEDSNTNWVHHRWDWILNEMIWAFEKELEDDWEAEFRHGSPKIDWELVSGEEGDDNAMYKMISDDSDYYVDYDKIREYNDRMRNGFRLFGKYYRGLWD